MTGDFDYEAAWHVLAGWLDRSTDHLPPAAVDDLAAAYLLAVEMGSKWPRLAA